MRTGELYMSRSTTLGLIVEWNGGMATGFTTKKEAERFIKHVCRKTAPELNYSIYSLIDARPEKKENSKFQK